MSLRQYRTKRDFKKTPEPRGGAARPGKTLSFFVQKHAARRLHYDFRLEWAGRLLSWAIPKGPSLDPSEKRLAVHVEDHPLDYGTFEGVIPAKQYGAGTVLLWDQGIWIPDGDPGRGYRQGRLKFRLQGKKLSGNWKLVRMGPAQKDKENWLLIKDRDTQARYGIDADITALRPEGISQVTTKKFDSLKSGDGALKTPMPALIKPQLATLSDHAPMGDDWLCEIKFDGYRILCRIDHGRIKLYTRTAKDWTKKWPSIAAAAAQVPVDQAWLDGELVALAEDGSIRFQALQNFTHHGMAARLIYYVFDLVYLNGCDLSHVSLIQRKQLLQHILSPLGTQGPIFYNDHIPGFTQDVFKHACLHGLEGIVAKRAHAPYTQGRVKNWLKVKCHHRQEFVIGGFTDPLGSRAEFGALFLGAYDAAKKLRYAGRVGTGFNKDMLTRLARKFIPLVQTRSPFSDFPTGGKEHGMHWLKPQLVAEVNFAEWTANGRVRQASFVGLRSDKPAREIVRELPDPEVVMANVQPRRKRTSSLPPRVAGVSLTHVTRILFPDTRWTKLDLAHYYEQITPWILPHLHQRPLTLVRCPQGGKAKCFFQKHVSASTAPEIERIQVTEDNSDNTYMMANTLPALISLVQMGVLELHTWGAQQGHLDRPDRMIFDLDPAPNLPWIQVIEAAQLMRVLLDDIGLKSFIKTTGGKGLHIAVPLKPERPWHEIKAYSRAIAEHLAQTLPERFTSKITKSQRINKIFIDYLRNTAGATAVAAYSTRARSNAPISVPIAWDELNENLHADSYTLGNIQDRLQRLGADPWAEYFTLKQRITAAMARRYDI